MGTNWGGKPPLLTWSRWSQPPLSWRGSCGKWQKPGCFCMDHSPPAHLPEPGLWGSCAWKCQPLLVSQPPVKGRREQRRKEHSLPSLTSWLQAVPLLTCPSPGARRMLWSQACQPDPTRCFCRCINWALEATRHTDRIKQHPEIWANI